MKKLTVLNFFGGGRGAQAKAAKALGISTAAVSKWPEELPKSAVGRFVESMPDVWRELSEIESKSNIHFTGKKP